MHCIAWCLNNVATITCKPHGMRSILKLTSVIWMLLCGLLKLKAASRIVFATCWNYRLHIAHISMAFAACSAKICKLHGPYHFLKPTPANCAELATVWESHVWIGRCLQHLAARPLFLASCGPSFFPHSFPCCCRNYFLPSCLFFVPTLLPLIHLREGCGASVQ